MRLELNKAVKVKPAEEIMVGFLAASVVEGDCWKEEVANMCVVASSQSGGITAEQYKAYKALSEQEFKEKNKLKQMPSKYRSTKSVIIKALKNNVELLDDDGFPRGKTEVEKNIKAVTSNDPHQSVIVATGLKIEGSIFRTPLNTYEKCFYAAEFIKQHWGDLDSTSQDVITKLLKGIV